jgi:riboflavin kinase/FMN adenylyltransferase
MKVFSNLDDLPSNFGPTIVSVGNFDGVHLAHTRVLKEIARRGRAEGKRSIAVTFEPHPMRFLRPESGLKLLTPTPEKTRLLDETEIDATVILPFNDVLAAMSPEDFANSILKNRLRAAEVHEGENFRFGCKASGDVALLKQLGATEGFEVVLYPELRVGNQPVSSSRIRSLLEQGEVGRARRLLGRPFSIRCSPQSGRGYGTKYTVPTINLGDYTELVPKNGVYITRTGMGTECFDSVTNVGNRPTFGADSFAIESHLLNFHPLEVTEKTEVKLQFLHRLRDEVKFPSVEDLREQIRRDVSKTQRYFKILSVVTARTIPSL